jgi:hypothetical protein
MLNGEISNISNLSSVKRINNYFFDFIDSSGDMGGNRRKRYGDFGLRKNERQF